MASDFERAVHAVVGAIDEGSVLTYGEVALEAGHPGSARAVGNVLAGADGLAWWRVVTASGRLVPGNEAEHAALLRAEGVAVEGGRVARRRAGGPRDRPVRRSAG